MLTIDNTCLNQLLLYDTIIVGLSGGQDSVALLHLLQSFDVIKPKLKAVHVHHGLSQYADEWLLFCERLCKTLDIQFVSHKVCIAGSNIEAKARATRYRVFEGEMASIPSALVLAHHADDQAETLLLNLFRGAGVEGLSAMPVVRPFANGILLRPLLRYPKNEITAYTKAHQLEFVEDDSNDSCDFSRNYIRHEIMPKIKHKWPRVLGAMGLAAKHCQSAHNLLKAEITAQFPNIQQTVLSLNDLYELPRDKWNFILRHWLQTHAVQSPSTDTLELIIDEVIYAKKDSTPKLSFGEVSIRRYQGALYLMHSETVPTPDKVIWNHFPHSVCFGHYTLQVTQTRHGFYLPEGGTISIRKRHGGERIVWRGCTRSLKKLLQAWQIPPWVRDNIPLIFVDDQLAIVPGFAVADDYYRSNKEGCLQVMALTERDIYETA